ncbi:TPA: Hok/Gef family protein [Providencia alcalifaciens]|uniref:Hok/Gef family protein n=1 Tax=Providencia alcalifaciens TaxID=126385 RepID=A0AAW9V6N3_9GAMM|nr:MULTISPECIES: Hok/Gef family protein [Providencia]MBF0691010.1 Hok/Gef family protein [Providencia alcalifaciens]MTB32153.1 Hok/Gef family protein [Providencia alcalifaciens]MTC33391.1 Hok/Gef family protein [Providencia alcalifaciens]MTC50264.1 Hok/Gef family protein [Providencia alcalifaciens]MTC97772.1 Hok/Gef family protein [Providencia alcalifaciens]
MTKFALIGLMTVCITVLCLSLQLRDRLCTVNVVSGNTKVQATLLCIE